MAIPPALFILIIWAISSLLLPRLPWTTIFLFMLLAHR
jgi:hypothetical protein